MKVLSVVLIVLAVLIGIVPQFTDCESQGRALTLQDGRQVPMKCHWTAQAELATSVPLLAVGGVLLFNRRKESRISLGILGIILGVMIILLPTVLVGVCMSAEMICNSVMKPVLILTGSLVILASLAVTLTSLLRKENAFPA